MFSKLKELLEVDTEMVSKDITGDEIWCYGISRCGRNEEKQNNGDVQRQEFARLRTVGNASGPMQCLL